MIDLLHASVVATKSPKKSQRIGAESPTKNSCVMVLLHYVSEYFSTQLPIHSTAENHRARTITGVGIMDCAARWKGEPGAVQLLVGLDGTCNSNITTHGKPI